MNKNWRDKRMKKKEKLIKKWKNKWSGITLIALVVTIIVLLILAAVAINLTIGDNGIFTRAQDATKEVYTGNGSINWNNDTSKFVDSGNPFFVRGGAIVNGKYAGVFQSDYNNNSGGNGFRVVLVEAGT